MNKAKASTTLMLGWAIVVAGAVAANADNQKTAAAEKVLLDKGLTKNDRKFLLDEKAAIEKYDEAKSASTDYQKAMNRYATIAQHDEGIQTLEAQRQGLQQQVEMIQVQLNSMGSGSGRMRQMVASQQAPLRQQQAQDRAMITQINSQIQASKAQAPKADERKSATAEFERSRKARSESIRQLKEEIDSLQAKYHELGLDKTVTDALAQLRQSTTLNYRLGPSDEVIAATKFIHDGKKSSSIKTKPTIKKKTTTKSS